MVGLTGFAPAASYVPQIGPGSANTAGVTCIQKALGIDPTPAPYGTFGTRTYKAVKEFQSQHGLPRIGAVGPATGDQLIPLAPDGCAEHLPSGGGNGQIQSNPTNADQRSYPDCPLLIEGMRGSYVERLQRDLNSVNSTYNLPKTGFFGALTRSAVLDFQGRNNLPADGNVGGDTADALTKQAVQPPQSTVEPDRAPGISQAESLPSRSGAAKICKGVGGAANNLLQFGIGGLHPPILGQERIGTPYLDGDVVRADSVVPFYSAGSCGSQVAFQMETRACGRWGCKWETRNHGQWTFFWEHMDTAEVAQQVTMSCREGTHSYRVKMNVIGLKSDSEQSEGRSGASSGAIGAVLAGEGKNGPVVKLTCD